MKTNRSLMAALMGALLLAVVPAQAAKVPYGTFFGGNLYEDILDMTVDNQGNIYLAGITRSTSLQTNPPVVMKGKDEALIVKLDPTGKRILYATVLSGLDDDDAESIAVDAQGNAYVAGTTYSKDFPVKSAYQTINRGGGDAFIAKLDPQGNIVYSTYLGGGSPQPCGCTPNDRGTGITVDSQGRAHVVGLTYSFDFPKTAASTGGDRGDAFLAVIGEHGDKLVFSATIGGREGYDSSALIRFDSAGHLYWAGTTMAAAFPTTPGAYQTQMRGGVSYGDAFVVQVDINAKDWIVRSTLLGGTGADVPYALAFDPAGNVWLSGRTMSSTFPVTANAFQKTWGGGTSFGDIFMARLSPQLDKLQYASFLGGSGEENGLGLEVDRFGYVHVTGYTKSTNLPVTADAIHQYRGKADALYGKFSPDGTRAETLTFIGGGDYDYGTALAMAPDGNVWLAGQTLSFDMHGIATNALQRNPGGQEDAFLLMIENPQPASTSVKISTVANAASYESGAVAPGEIITLFGEGLGPAQLATAQLTPQGYLPTEAGGVQVHFDGTPGRMIYASAGQTALIAPYSVQGKLKTRMVVTYKGQSSDPVDIDVAQAAPALFSANSSGRGPAAALNQDGTLNTADHPAAAGSVVVLYGTGEGPTSPGGVDGKPAPADLAQLPRPMLSPSVTIGGLPATVAYAGGVPYVTAGEFQMNVIVPNLQPGNHEVIVRFGDHSSQRGVTLAIR